MYVLKVFNIISQSHGLFVLLFLPVFHIVSCLFPLTFVILTVAPVCRQGQRTVYSTGRHEMAKIACEIEANPAEATYVWKFNATLGETIDIPASLVAVDRGRSIAHYTPMTENVSEETHTLKYTEIYIPQFVFLKTYVQISIMIGKDLLQEL